MSDEGHPGQGILQARVRELWKARHRHRSPRLVYHQDGSPTSAVAVDIPGIVENILHVLPETTDIVVINTGSALGEFWAREARRVLQPFTDRVRFDWLYELSLEEVLGRVSVLPPHTAIFYGGLIVDGAGVPREAGEALVRLRTEANAPIFGVFEADVGRGLVGGPVVSILEASRRASVAAHRILSGEAPEEIQWTL